MKVLYVTNGDGYAGASIALNKLLKELEGKIVCEVVFPKKKGLFSKDLEERGIKCHHIRYTMYTYSQSRNVIMNLIRCVYTIITGYIAIFKLKRISKNFMPDIIHTNVGPIDIGYKTAKALGIPHVWHLREYIDKDFDLHLIPSFSIYTSRFKDDNNYCIAITNGVYNYFKLNNKAICIYDGPLPERETNIQIKQNYFLFVGRLQEAKGDLSLISSFLQYANEGGKFDLYLAGLGTPERERELKAIVDASRLTNRVHFLGYRTDIYELMSHANALFVTSRFEGFGFITAEAMYNHCLVVGRNTAGTKEQFDNGYKLSGREIGIRFETDNELPIIMHTLESNDHIETVNLAYQTVKKLYLSSLSANKVYFYYESILQIV